MKSLPAPLITLKWLNNNLLFISSLFLLAFIPLFPKIPLFDILPGYIVRIRLEDIFVLMAGVIWIRDALKQRFVVNSVYFWIVMIYTFVGLISVALGVFLLETIPTQLLHIGKSGLHFFRYLEYFSVFFFLFSSIRQKWQLRMALAVLALTLLLVVGYGIGQKYFQFPLYSTMNREYSKGEKLFLQEGARPQSTFAGHYDLGAFLVVILPLIFSYSLSLLKRRLLPKDLMAFLSLQFVHAAGVFMLLLSGAKTSLLAYLAGMGLVFSLHLWRLGDWRQRLRWGSIAACFGLVGLAAVWIFVPPSTKQAFVSLAQRSMSAAREKPEDFSGVPREGSVWSENALRYGLSMGIRLDTLWPQALLGLVRNPLSGSGYGTLAMQATGGFSEADSTDNNYLRTLGETGVMGFVVFYGFILILAKEMLTLVRSKNALSASLAVGFLGSMVGLLINAVYIDVFAASKVAFSFWAMAGVVTAAIHLEGVRQDVAVSLVDLGVIAHLRRRWPIYTAGLLAFFLLHQNPYADNSVTMDIPAWVGSLENLVAAKCFIALGQFSLCRNSGLVLGPHFSVYSLFLLPFLSFFRRTSVFYFLNTGLIGFSIIATYGLLRRFTLKPIGQFLCLSSVVSLFSFFRLTQSPLTNFWFLAILTAPMIALLIMKSTHVISNNKKASLVFTGLLLIGLLFLSSGGVANMSQRFRNAEKIYPHWAVQTMNAQFDEHSPASYVISSLNPYYADLYSDNFYQLLPLFPDQQYMDRAANVWGERDYRDLNAAYARLQAEGASLYLSDYGLEPKSARMLDLKRSFDLAYWRLGCNEQCNLFTVSPIRERISPYPTALSGTPLNVQKISAPYTFGIVNLRYEPGLQLVGPLFTTADFTVKMRDLLSTPQVFMMLTGDLIYPSDATNSAIFKRGVLNRTKTPLVYQEGNTDAHPERTGKKVLQTFFTGTEYFIILGTDGSSRITIEQKIQLYNAFLEIEKLSELKNIVVVGHDIDWQDTSDSENIVHLLRQKFADFPQLKKFVFTQNHDPGIFTAEDWLAHQVDAENNTYYYAGLLAGAPKDVSFRITVDEEGGLTVEPVSQADELNVP